MLIDGNRVPHLRDSALEAEQVTRLVRERMPLLTPVQPVIALVQPSRLTIVDRPEQVKVIDADDLRRWLLRLHSVLSAGEVQEASDLIDRSGSAQLAPVESAAE